MKFFQNKVSILVFLFFISAFLQANSIKYDFDQSTAIDFLSVAAKQNNVVIPKRLLESNIRQRDDLSRMNLDPKLIVAIEDAAMMWFRSKFVYNTMISMPETQVPIFLNSLFDGLGYINVDSLGETFVEPYSLVKTEKRIYRKGEAIRVILKGDPYGADWGWAGLYRKGASDRDYLTWNWMVNNPASIVFKSGLGSQGDFEVRFFKWRGYNRISTYSFKVRNNVESANLLDDPQKSKWLELHFKEYPALTGFYTVARRLYANQFGEKKAKLLDNSKFRSDHQEWGLREAIGHWAVFFLDAATGGNNEPNLDGKDAYKSLQHMMHKSISEFEYTYDASGRITNMNKHPLVQASELARFYSMNSPWITHKYENIFNRKLASFSFAKDYIQTLNEAMAIELAGLQTKDADLTQETGLEKFGRIVSGIATFGASEAVRAISLDVKINKRHRSDWLWEMNQLKDRSRLDDVPRLNWDLNISQITSNTISSVGAVLLGVSGLAEVDETLIGTSQLFLAGARKLTRGVGMLIGKEFGSEIISATRFSQLPSRVFSGRIEHSYIEFDGEHLPVVEVREGTTTGYSITVSRVRSGEEALYEFNPETRVQGARLVRTASGEYVKDELGLLGGGIASQAGFDVSKEFSGYSDEFYQELKAQRSLTGISKVLIKYDAFEKEALKFGRDLVQNIDSPKSVFDFLTKNDFKIPTTIYRSSPIDPLDAARKGLMTSDQLLRDVAINEETVVGLALQHSAVADGSGGQIQSFSALSDDVIKPRPNDNKYAISTENQSRKFITIQELLLNSDHFLQQGMVSPEEVASCLKYQISGGAFKEKEIFYTYSASIPQEMIKTINGQPVATYLDGATEADTILANYKGRRFNVTKLGDATKEILKAANLETTNIVEGAELVSIENNNILSEFEPQSRLPAHMRMSQYNILWEKSDIVTIKSTFSPFKLKNVAMTPPLEGGNVSLLLKTQGNITKRIIVKANLLDLEGTIIHLDGGRGTIIKSTETGIAYKVVRPGYWEPTYYASDIESKLVVDGVNIPATVTGTYDDGTFDVVFDESGITEIGISRQNIRSRILYDIYGHPTSFKIDQDTVIENVRLTNKTAFPQ